MIQKGYYKHYKGGLYEVRGISLDPDSLEQRVQYCAIKDPTTEYSKPLNDFISRKTVGNKVITRYQFICSKD